MLRPSPLRGGRSAFAPPDPIPRHDLSTMTPHTVDRFTRAAFVLSGASLALWVLAHPWGHVAGAHVGRTGQWVLSHSFHFLAGLFLLFAVLGLAVRRLPAASRLETAAQLAAFLGAALFAGTGLITAYVWPVLAVHAPALVEARGPFLGPPHPLIPVSALLYSAGLVLLAFALVRAGAVPLPAGTTLAAGALLMLAPPPPVAPTPWIVLVAGGVLAGIGTAWLGLALRASSTVDAASPAPSARPAVPA
jgi:hypothetical protein